RVEVAEVAAEQGAVQAAVVVELLEHTLGVVFEQFDDRRRPLLLGQGAAREDCKQGEQTGACCQPAHAQPLSRGWTGSASFQRRGGPAKGLPRRWPSAQASHSMDRVRPPGGPG